ncbi:MAG: histidine kinase [Bacteroidales bacterium]|nr:histidine kinase [Bacteroidales bacterium]
MNKFITEEKNENRLYLLIWAGVFVLGALSQMVQGFSGAEGEPTFSGVLQLWLRILPFLVLFLLHNYLVAPLLLRHEKPWAYACAVTALMAVFAVFVVMSHLGPDPSMRPPEPPGPRGDVPPSGMRKGPMPMNPEVLKVILGAMMLMTNLGIKYQFRAQRNVLRVRELEKENLQHRLDALRYQINPHFFMNTLNNIHALVDLDPEKAKESIVELSKLMRHILYDSDSPTIPLSQETEFLRHYVSLMRIRYPEGVEVSLSLPENDGGAQVPPLVFASFVENAFKHGVSYETPSFIHISVSQNEDKVVFRCENSRALRRKDPASGLGQENVRRRLDLLYGDRYLLDIDSDSAAYRLLLAIPAHPETPSAV